MVECYRQVIPEVLGEDPNLPTAISSATALRGMLKTK